MNDPWRSFKALPWVSLISTAFVTITLAKIVDIAILLAYANVFAARFWLELLFTPPWGLIIVILLSLGLGALSVWIMETFFNAGPIYGGTLWGLVLCLILTLGIVILIGGLVGVTGGILDLNQNVIIGMMIGVFWRGRRYWRWY